MSKPIRIKILDTGYSPKTNLVKWHIRNLEVEGNNEMVLAWLGSDLHTAIGISQPIPPELIKDFCIQMRGKEINLVMMSDLEYQSAEDLKDSSESELEAVHNEIDKYPYYEVIKEIQKEDKKNVKKSN